MEATGTYNLVLAYYLYEHSGQVFVLNPLVIKHFMQMHFGKLTVIAQSKNPLPAALTTPF